MQPFGDSTDPRGFWLLLQEHLTWLRVHNYSEATIHKRAVYVRAFALWCLERDLLQPTHDQQTDPGKLPTFPVPSSQTERPAVGLERSAPAPQRSPRVLRLAGEGQSPPLQSGRRDRTAASNPRRLPKAILSADEVEQVLSQPDTTTPLGLRDRAILETFYSTGIRRAELCSLRLDDIQVDRQAVFVNQGKGNKDRYVPIGMRALVWIARYVEQARDKLLLDEKERTLFVTNQGEPINPDSLTEYARRYIQAAGVNKPGACHIFRHTMATLMHDNGAELAVIQVILGHTKTETTQIYARTSLRRLLEIHGNTHPAEREEPEEKDD